MAQAVARLRDAGVILHATEGVWGLACDPFNKDAVARLLNLKSRPVQKGLIVIGASERQFASELMTLAPEQLRMVRDSWPGAVTWLLPNQRFPDWVTGGRDTVAVRVSAHPQVCALSIQFSGPLVSTSANPAGLQPALTEDAARAYFPRGVDYVLPGHVLEPGAPSSIRELSGKWLRGTG